LKTAQGAAEGAIALSMAGCAKHAFAGMKRTFMATMDVPQKKKGEISSSPDASCEAKVGSEVVC